MKKLVAFCLFIPNIIFAQEKQDGIKAGSLNFPHLNLEIPVFGAQKNFLSKISFKNELPSAQLSQEDLIKKFSTRKALQLQAVPARKTANGPTYILQPDHITCFVPDITKTEQMPVVTFKNKQAADNMPNAYKETEIIPGGK